MKKIVVFLLVCSVLLLSACSTDSYETYLAATEKTENIVKGQKEIQFEMHMDFDYKDIPKEDLEYIHGMEDISMKGFFRFDDSKEQMVADINLNLGGVGMDSELYKDGEKIWIKLNSLGKYLALHELEMEGSDLEMEFSEETLEKIAGLWEKYVDEENLFVGEAVLVDTPMGDVKSTRFYVQLDEINLKDFMEEMFILLEEEGIIDFGDGEVTMDMDNVIINEMTVESFIDIDNYIVEETLIFDMNFLDSDFEGIRFEMKELIYDIEKDQDIVIPDIPNEKIMKLDDIEAEAQSLFDFTVED